MKISRVQATWCRVPIPYERQHTSDFGRVPTFDSVIVRVETECGITGWGEAKAGVGSAAACAGLAAIINDDYAPLLLGQDPRDISRLWDVMYNTPREGYAVAGGYALPQVGRRGLSVSAIAGVDVALWDILGKSLDVPVWRLLGGKRVDRMPAYASGGWADAKNIGEQLQGYCDKAGFRAVKMRVGVMDGSPGRSAARVRAARERLGPDIRLMADAHGTWTVAEARAFARMVEDCDLFWFEEPVSADDKAGMAEVRRSSSVPISAGESEFTRHDFREICELRAADVLQPDLAIAGGLTEGLRISALASAYNLRLAPHLWSGAPAFAAGMHLAATQSAGFILEYSLGHNPMLHDLIEESFPVEDGHVAIPDRPGLGITVRETFLQQYGQGGRA
ncbi:mandelate racemase/muconate lactonizing enzyme family protein [Pseudoroseomonas wenyumeiae]|uniref:Mandelate racemase/muconate lactonizing enzyme family protein n=1 Tax=Teichococcus wenyumeiae TaxID=2478470 RepID=A0A3A9JI10_9PROT|nr:mandelate racemase/muconate lactonizing enzyme family protein [Pseudoroseomonas wenyumeiae]RKK03264.1 mandelate racemase/muconate lactonizing enzyme family protein [Pseudoroseomonas wenyumeiae]RMI16953.1 mandelate racemase/muconate lactonizing enzyme family protein [Pseudoroseomonas wenyumeiae]